MMMMLLPRIRQPVQNFQQFTNVIKKCRPVVGSSSK